MPNPLENLAIVESDWPVLTGMAKTAPAGWPARDGARRLVPASPPGWRSFMRRRSSSGRVRSRNSVTARRGSVRVGRSWSPTLG